jgi:hypothetical protein
MSPVDQVLQNGRYWYPVAFAARRLRTSAKRIRELMGNGTLDWCQKGRSRIMIASVESVEAYLSSEKNPKRASISPSLRSPDPLARRANDIPKLGNRKDGDTNRSNIFLKSSDSKSKG